nr:MAG TPA: hypothetical protein [Bacteriophage sp.]
MVNKKQGRAVGTHPAWTCPQNAPYRVLPGSQLPGGYYLLAP